MFVFGRFLVVVIFSAQKNRVLKAKSEKLDGSFHFFAGKTCFCQGEKCFFLYVVVVGVNRNY